MRIHVKRFTITGANVLAVEAGTNCPQGGDGGHGGRALLRFVDLACTGWSLTVQDNDRHLTIDNPRSVELVFLGDSEADGLARALEKAARHLRDQLADDFVDVGKFTMDIP